MPGKNVAATRLCGLRSAPPVNGIIRFLSALILVAPIVLGPAHFAYAISLFETQITAHDAAAGDQFGFAVSVSGSTVVVGAPFDGDAGLESGGAYVFQRDEGGSDNWEELKKLIAADAAALDWFGFAVAISGNTVVVGAPFDDDAGSASGAVYVFERDVGGSNAWGLVKKLTHSDAAAGDDFGFAVAISGNTIVVGAPVDDDVKSAPGAVYVFERDTGGSDGWGELKKLTGADAEAGDGFGFTVAISGDTVAVGAPFRGDNVGSAYVFERALGGAENWGEVKRLRADDGDAGDQFGYAVSVSQNTILVGARLRTVRVDEPRPPPAEPIEVELDNAGTVYFFERDAGGAEEWGKVKRLTAANAQAGDQFGFAVAIRGNQAVVGALYAGDNRRGRAYLHQRNLGGLNGWGRLEKLAASDGRRRDEYGFGVAISAGTVVVGAPEADAQCPDDRDCDSGSTYVYTITQTKDQQKCINALNKSLAKVSKAHAKAFSKCVKNYAKTGSSAEACLMAANSSVEKAEQKTIKQEMRRCTDSAPNFGATDAVTVNDAAMQLEIDVVREIFGVDLDAALVTSAVDKDAAKCQGAVVKSVNKCQKSKLKVFNRCKKTGLKDAMIRESADLESCVGEDPKGVVAKACDPVSGKLATRVLPKSCVSRGVDLSSAFPGCDTDDSEDLAMCLDQIVECRVCVALNQADDLAFDCDLLDDGVENSSCP
jgi:hypothetical protein